MWFICTQREFITTVSSARFFFAVPFFVNLQYGCVFSAVFYICYYTICISMSVDVTTVIATIGPHSLSVCVNLYIYICNICVVFSVFFSYRFIPFCWFGCTGCGTFYLRLQPLFNSIAKIYAKSKILFNAKLQTEYLKIGINYVVSCVVLKITNKTLHIRFDVDGIAFGLALIQCYLLI